MNPEEMRKFNHSINDLMMEMEKDDIYDAACYHGLGITIETLKEELIEKLSEVLVKDFESDCQYILQNDFFYR
jgi:hypothetical protein